MKLFANLLGSSSKPGPAEAPVAPISQVAPKLRGKEQPLPLDLSNLADEAPAAHRPAAASAAVNIWDLDDSAEAEAPAPVAAAQPSRARRNRTRLIGFDTSEGSSVVDLFDSAESSAEVTRVQFPVGWLLVVEGPGRGHCFSLFAGLAQIGRSDENAVQLDFGDSSVSRNNHAAIVYDPAERNFVLGHGGKANIVRLNGKPVIANEDLNDGDKVKIGETTLQLKALCGADFDWADTDGTEDEGHEDVAIA